MFRASISLRCRVLRACSCVNHLLDHLSVPTKGVVVILWPLRVLSLGLQVYRAQKLKPLLGAEDAPILTFRVKVSAKHDLGRGVKRTLVRPLPETLNDDLWGPQTP